MTAVRRPPLSEWGTTLLEVMITVSILSVAMAATLGVFSSVLRADRSNATSVAEREATTLALAQVVRDLRAAEVVTPPPTSSAAVEELEVGVPDGSGGLTYVRYEVDAEDRLVRRQLDGPGGAVEDTRLLTGALDLDAASLFAYFDAGGEELRPGVDAAEVIAGCAVRVRVTVSGREADAAFRNVRPEEATC